MSVLCGLVGGWLYHHQASKLNLAGSVDALALSGCTTVDGTSYCAADDGCTPLCAAARSYCCSAVAAFLSKPPS